MNEPTFCNQSQFYGFYFCVSDLFPVEQKEVETVDIEYVEIKDIHSPLLIESK